MGEKTTVVDAKLRLKQYTDNKGFDVLGTCLVDIDKGLFNSNVELEGADFNAKASAMNVMDEDAPLVGVDAENWIEAEMARSNVAYSNNIDRTQFRIYFYHVDGVSDTAIGWYSAASLDNEPQLLVRYTEME